jgi:hypothetical protein
MDFTGNPWIVDAIDVTALAATSGNGNSPGDVISVGGLFYLVMWKGPASILQVEYQDYVADTDQLSVTRYNTKPFVDLDGASDLETVRSGVVGWTVDGLLVPNNGITNGSCRVYHR